MEEGTKVRTAERWATIVNGKVVGWADGHPAQELLPNQISLTPDEMSMLKTCWGDLSKAEDILRSLRHKIKKVGEVK